MHRLTRGAPVLGLVLTLSGPALAVDGVREINQTCAEATGCDAGDAAGFPVTIREPGSYRLTSNLTSITRATTYVEITTDHVTLDLNGFSIGWCLDGGACIVLGDGRGVLGVNANNVTLLNGTVVGNGGGGIVLGSDARVESLTVEGNGRNGIQTGNDSLVVGNRVRDNGEHGLLLGAGSGYENNLINNSGIVSVSGGRSLGENNCDDGTCPARRRRYYLTPGTVDGSGTLTACVTGYHFASIYEIAETSTLEYNTGLGLTTSDSGSGPPDPSVGDDGWVRGGRDPVSTTCQTWTSSGSDDTGWTADLQGELHAASPGPDEGTWDVGSLACSESTHVWCVEN